MKLKQDKYRKARGGHSRLLDVCCSKCSEHLFYYQKDGPGILKRTYLDRICKAKEFENFQYLSFDKLTQLICPKCGEHIGTPIIYKKENRLAFRLFEGAVSKKIVSVDI
jgi:ribosomal protein S27E